MTSTKEQLIKAITICQNPGEQKEGMTCRDCYLFPLKDENGNTPTGEVCCEHLGHEIVAWLRRDEWISVEDRLPEECERILFCSEGRVMAGVFISSFIDNEDDCIWDKSVTHWQPLPEAPEEVKE